MSYLTMNPEGTLIHSYNKIHPCVIKRPDLDVTETDADWSEVDANGLKLGLNARERAEQGDGGGAVVSFQPDSSIDDEVQRLTRAGVSFTGGISDHEWGRIAPFQDSEGNDLQLYTPPQG